MDKQYVETNILGGLGNQMFQFAAGYALSEALNANLILNISEFNNYEPWKYELHNFPRIKNQFSCRDEETNESKLKIPFLNFKKGPTKYNEKNFYFDTSFFDNSAPVIIEGYFQSYKYFEKYSGQLKELFLDIRKTKHIQTSLDIIKSKPTSVSVHIRRGDYITNIGANSVHGVIDDDYYAKSLKLMEKIYPDCYFFLFTDEPQYVEEKFKFLKGKSLIASSTDCLPHEDMYLMSNCNHHIIANSSFSWWAAWLNKSLKKTVFAPRKWFTRKILIEKPTMDLFPEEWILL